MFKPADGNGRICESYILKIYVSRLRETDAEIFGDSSFEEFQERLVQASRWIPEDRMFKGMIL